MRRWRAVLALSGIAAATVAGAQPAEPGVFAHGLFSRVELVPPSGTPQQVVLWLSGEGGPDAADRALARTLADRGALVGLIDTPAFAARLDREGATCGFPAGAFDNLSRTLQAAQHLPGVRAPVLAGRGAGGALAYAMLAQGEPGAFAGAVSIGFCPRWPFRQPVCAGKALPASRPASAPSYFSAASAAAGGANPGSLLAAAARLPAPWTALQPADAPACAAGDAAAFVARVPRAQWRRVPAGMAPLASALAAAYDPIAAANRPPPPSPEALADLPVVEVPVAAKAPRGRRYAILVSGDGGWAGIDRALAAELSAAGVPVAGLDSLRYFWSERTPQGLAADLDRMIAHYAALWQRDELVLIGFSQGADVLPFALNRLNDASRARLKLAALLSPGQKASFEFKVQNWLMAGGEQPVLPEAERLSAANTLCVHGALDKNSLCPLLAPGNARQVELPGSHHFDGNYARIARIVLENAGS